ncbi:hypothetical protein C9E90_12455 [Salmonella enterica subsp. enterica serovar Enteritidis]|nr:hypothetical protein C9E90_12455 [Salmonella enterica subsp. enterica serovar Enteritidis]
MVSANASTRSTFGSSFRAFRSSLDISSSRYTLPDGASLIRPTDSAISQCSPPPAVNVTLRAGL